MLCVELVRGRARVEIGPGVCRAIVPKYLLSYSVCVREASCTAGPEIACSPRLKDSQTRQIFFFFFL